MENASKAETDAERKGIGTPATRAGVIEKLVKGCFIERKGKQPIPTEKGAELIKVLPDSVKSAKLTADLVKSCDGVNVGADTALKLSSKQTPKFMVKSANLFRRQDPNDTMGQAVCTSADVNADWHSVSYYAG